MTCDVASVVTDRAPGTMNTLSDPEFLARLAPLRPRQHRYGARMVGSALEA